jgi:hypothetical protein
VQNLTARQRLVKIVFADGIEEFMRRFRSVQDFLNDTFCLLTSIRLIKHNATSGNSTSYMLAYMRPVYKTGQRDSGTWTLPQYQPVINVFLSRRHGCDSPEQC